MMVDKMQIDNFKGSVLKHELMKQYTSFHIGGAADYVVVPSNEQDVIHAMNHCRIKKIPFEILGAGTNTLISDTGFSGVIILIKKTLSQYKVLPSGRVFVQAGMKTQDLLQKLLQDKYTGYSFLAGIPGTVGGCAAMNAGTNRGQFSDIVHSIIYTDGEHVKVIKGKLLKSCFQYRSSVFLENKQVVLSVVLSLPKNDIQAEQLQVKKYLQKRKKSQPIQTLNAGCFWKNPEKYSAGYLIEHLGLKGKQVGGAMISNVHANFIVNLQDATASDIRLLAQMVEKEVWERMGVKLVREVREL